MKKDTKSIFDEINEEFDEDFNLPNEFLDASSLTEEQAQILDNILDAINDNCNKIILSGSAGVGKTYLVKYLMNKMYNESFTGNYAYITAPTNRAVKVLIGDETNKPDYMKFSTIHKALYMKRKVNEKTGVVSFPPDYKPKGEEPFENAFAVVVDEGSMLNSEILFYLEEPDFAHIPMIFLGDIKQLPPIGENSSPIFERPKHKGKTVSIKVDDEISTHIIPEYRVFTLNKIIRQKEGNPIIQISRDLPKIGLMIPNLTPEGYGYDYSSNYNELVKLVAEDDNTRFLAWTNDCVNKFNFHARNHLYFNPQKLQLDETIVFAKPHEGLISSHVNSDELKIKKLEVKTENVIGYKGRGKYSNVVVKGELTYYLINSSVKVIHESSEREFKIMLDRIKALALKGLSWKKWFDFAEKFAQVSYRYASTIHKAQGGTFDTVVIDMKDVNRNFKNSELKALWYTGITRASNKVIFYRDVG